MLEYAVRHVAAGEVVVALAGELTGEEWSNRLRRFLEEHYVNDGVSVIRLDVQGVSLLDLEGVATLALLWKEATRRGKALVVEGAQHQPAQKLRQAGMLELLQEG